MNLTIADGFKFGCGLYLASAFAIATLLLMAALGLFIASLAGVPVPFPGT